MYLYIYVHCSMWPGRNDPSYITEGDISCVQRCKDSSFVSYKNWNSMGVTIFVCLIPRFHHILKYNSIKSRL